MPSTRVKGLTVKDSEGNYNVYINAKLSNTEADKAMRHELEHIKRRHFWSNKSIYLIEKEAK